VFDPDILARLIARNGVLLVLKPAYAYYPRLSYDVSECFMSTLANTSAAHQASTTGKPRIAVVGAGLAGLSAAWLLKQKYQVTLFESHPTAGMGVHTCDYHSNGQHTRIDVPLRIFTQGYYPELFALYKYLGIEMERSDHAAVYQHLGGDKNQTLRPFFQYINKKIGRKKINLLHRNSLNFGGFLLVWAHYKFIRQAQKDVKQNRQTLATLSFGEYVNKHKFNHTYIQQILLPALAVTCTCDYDGILAYPADLILEYLTCGILDQGIVRAKLGVDGIVPKLTQGYKVLCHQEVQSVKENSMEHAIKLVTKNLQDNTVTEHEFDHVVLATQANVAKKILSTLKNSQQSDLLANIPMQSSTMVLHTDSDLVYGHEHHSSVSYIFDQHSSRPSTTVDLSKAFSTYSQQAPVFQTWNTIKTPRPDTVINSSDFTRPLVTLSSRESVAKLLEINKTSRIKICGSYMANKIPLLDAAVESSVKLARQLDCVIPWDKVGKQDKEVQAGDENDTTPALAY
jgi:predicted NAD/FAD-binding protein